METNESEQITDPSGTIIFDTSSGISLEEQQEILQGINAMSGGSRLLSEAAVVKARKKGVLFPLSVNIIALVLLGLGLALLFLLHGQDEQEIRESSSTLGLTERKLIQEIRQETNRQINEKENEINGMLSKLSEVDAEYRVLQESMETLTEVQKERAAYLLSMQEEYLLTLSDLQDEKTRIIEDSRFRETRLRNQAEERAAELSSRLDQSQADLGAVMEELMRLSSEQDITAMAEGQLSGLYVTVDNYIESGRLVEASGTLRAMKSFLDAPVFMGVRSMDAKKHMHLAAISAMEAAVAEASAYKEAASRSGAPVQNSESADANAAALAGALADLEDRNAVLERELANLERDISAFGAQGTEQDRVIAQYVSENSELRTRNANQQDTLSRRDDEIITLRNENNAKDQAAAELNNSNNSLRAQIQEANSRIELNEAELAIQRSENVILQAEKEDLLRQNESLQRQMEAAREAARTLLEN